MTENDLAFDRMIVNCKIIRKYCSENACETNDRFAVGVERLFESAGFIHRIAADFYLGSVPDNGFVTFVRLSASYTDKIVEQVRKNKIHPDYVRLLRLVLNYADLLTDLYGSLRDEQKDEATKGQLFMRTKPWFTLKRIYESVNLYDDFLPLKFSTCFCYWLPDDLRRGFKLVYMTIAAGKHLPWSCSSLFSSKYYDKYILDTYRNANLFYPFNIWHLSENPLIVNLVNFFVNIGLPVKSETLHLPKQTRFRLDWRGNILDFDRMTQLEIDAYHSDEVEQERQSSPGLRHRNHETIRCRYSYITSNQMVAESLERIRNETEPALKVLKRHTARKPAEAGKEAGKEARREPNNNCRIGDDMESASPADSKDPNPDAKLVLYIHGGAFFTMGAKSYEMFLRKIVDRLGGIRILAIDYSLTVPYPVPLQEILDVYLWLLSGRPEVKQKLGFYPKQIVLAGDSCGGFFSLSLTIVLNELNKMLRKSADDVANGLLVGLANGPASYSPIPLPSSIVSAYGVLSFSNLSPSMIMPVLEPIVETSLILIIISVLGANVWCGGDFKRIENTERYQSIVARKMREFAEESALSGLSGGEPSQQDDWRKPNDTDKPDDTDEPDNAPDSTPWFRCAFPTYVKRAAYIASFFDHPFLNPLLYADKFDELKSVSLYCMVGNNDPTLDSSIEMARSWKGKVCLDTFDKVTHAYLQVTSVSREATDAFEITVRRLQEAVGLRRVDGSV